MDQAQNATGEMHPEQAITKVTIDCEEVRDLLYLFLNNELEDDESQQVCSHLFDCLGCREAMSEHVKLSGSLKRTIPGIELRYYSRNN